MKKFLFIGLIFLSCLVFAKFYSHTLCDNPDYMCYIVKSGDSWNKLFPDKHQQDLVRRINRTNGHLYRGRKIAIPNELNRTDLFKHSPFSKNIESKDRKVVIIDLKEQAFGAFDQKGHLVHWGPVSGGQSWCSDVHRYCGTPKGTYFFTGKKGPYCISSKYPIPTGGSPMPYCMFFRNGYAMHGGYLPGYNASHGCIRMFYNDAKWLNQKFIQTGKDGTMLIVR